MRVTPGAPQIMASRNTRGFSTIELMLALGIVGVLLAFAIPSFDSFMANGRRAEVANDLLLAIKMARSEAEKRVMPITVCASDDQTTCHNNGTAFDSGWLLFTDQDRDGVLDAGEELLMFSAYTTSSHTVYGNARRFTFRPFGAAATNSSIVICDNRGVSDSRVVIVAQSGRARISETMSDGSAPAC